MLRRLFRMSAAMHIPVRVVAFAIFVPAVAALLFAAAALAEPPHAPAGPSGPAASPAEIPHAAPAPHADAHWTYGGATGPAAWGKLAPGNLACSTGQQQSPIDLSADIAGRAAEPTLAWSPVNGGKVINNGHTIQMNADGAGGVVIAGVRYEFRQVHFHHPSEHTINGKSYPLEAHLVHESADGRLAVIGVLFEEGANNPALDPIWATAPIREGAAAVAFPVDLAKLVPANTPAYRYQGSLTTPPCSETVTWTVLARPLTASRGQLESFASVFPNNARPVQPLNRRFVLMTEAPVASATTATPATASPPSTLQQLQRRLGL